MKILDYLKRKNIRESTDKHEAEIAFWKKEVRNYIDWYNGKIQHYELSCPNDNQKIKKYSLEYNAILTWFELHQKIKYLLDLQLGTSCFNSLKILDLGSGPFPSALSFADCDIYCLDPLFPEYLKLGYPYHLYEKRARFVYGYSENMPFEDNFFDAIISVNAIDHVDSLEKTSLEIKRVLKPGGLFRMHVHYHKKTPTEPIEINDRNFKTVFSWVNNLEKLFVSNTKTGHVLKNKEELYALWSNFNLSR